MDNRPSWFVSAFSNNGNDRASRFINGGFWENYCSDNYEYLINTIKVGDRIALKATHNKTENIPFNNNGKIVSVMEIKAIGMVTKNYYNGKKIGVKWKKVDDLKEWYFFTFIRSVWKIEANPKNWMSKELLEFTFNHKAQDISRFKNEPYWKKRFRKDFSYVEEIIAVLRKLNGEAHLTYIQEEIRKRNKIKGLNQNPNWRAEVRFTLQKLSSDSKSFAGGEDLFFRKSFSGEVWGLREISKKKVERYSKEKFLAETFMEPAKYEELVTVLKAEKSMIIKGASGVGDRFIAKRLAYSLLQEKDETKLLILELNHYQQGYDDAEKSIADGNTLKSDFILDECGFFEFCEKAERDNHRDYYFIIDKINRINLNRVMADLLFLFKRNHYQKNSKKTISHDHRNFFIPKNLYIVGIMETGDQCLRLIDYNLKQYFTFVEITPAFSSEKLNDVIKWSQPMNILDTTN
ncbi:MAG: hypothetical protein HY818_13245 [Acetobacterium woodii]|nr:hypothetical protein [Acetobacterium woodii]